MADNDKQMASGQTNNWDEMTHPAPATENHIAQIVRSINKLPNSVENFQSMHNMLHGTVTSHSTYIYNKMTAQLIQYTNQLRSQYLLITQTQATIAKTLVLKWKISYISKQCYKVWVDKTNKCMG